MSMRSSFCDLLFVVVFVLLLVGCGCGGKWEIWLKKVDCAYVCILDVYIIFICVCETKW